MKTLSCSLLIIGAGPGGYVCAVRAGQLGLDTIIVEEAAPGGTCLNVGCIPSKALIHAADEFEKLVKAHEDNALGLSVGKPNIDLEKTIDWKDGIVAKLTGGVRGLLKKAKVRAIEGRATLRDGKAALIDSPDGNVLVTAKAVVIATGSSPVELPFLPFGDKVISSTEALALTRVPKSLAIVGGGYIGLEIGTAFAKLGAKVTVVEAADRILPQYDTALVRPVAENLKSLGVKIMTDTKAKGAERSGLSIELSDGSIESVKAEKILVAVGRRPRSDTAGIPELGLKMNGPFLAIDETCQTSMRGVYAIGDVTGGPMLAHRAMAQGEMVAEQLSGLKRVWDKYAIPAVCFTDPEVVTCGMSPDEAKGVGITVRTGQFPLAANGRSMTMDATSGFVRVVARDEDGVILGLQGVGKGLSELSSAFSTAIELQATLEDLSQVVQAHPTQSEALQEACLGALRRSLHV